MWPHEYLDLQGEWLNFPLVKPMQPEHGNRSMWARTLWRFSLMVSWAEKNRNLCNLEFHPQYGNYPTHTSSMSRTMQVHNCINIVLSHDAHEIHIDGVPLKNCQTMYDLHIHHIHQIIHVIYYYICICFILQHGTGLKFHMASVVKPSEFETIER